MKTPCVYILASKQNGTLYLGVTSDLVQRVRQHKNRFYQGFTQKYGVHRLVWYEVHDGMESAINREKALKKWHRLWKLQLIERSNPYWADLYDELVCTPSNPNGTEWDQMVPESEKIRPTAAP